MTMITPDFSDKPTFVVTDAVTELLRVHARHLKCYCSRTRGDSSHRRAQKRR